MATWKFVLTFILAPAALMGIGAAGLELHPIANGKCSYYGVDTLPSPTGRLSVARTEWRCPGDEQAPPMLFALLRSGEPFDEKRVFLTSADYEGLRSSLTIFAKWIDDEDLLVASPEGSTLKVGRNEFDGVHIQYALYPMDSGTIRNQRLRKQVEKQLDFHATFRMDDGVGLAGIGCHLDVHGNDGEYLDELTLSLTARTTFAINSIDGNKMISNKAYSSYDFQIAARDETQWPDKHATGADIVGFSPHDGRSTFWTYDSNYPGVRAPGGGPVPTWLYGFLPNDPHDLISIANNVGIGAMAIRVGFWLDNNIVVYSMEKPPEQTPIAAFERCIDDNHIFATPLFGHGH